MKTIKHDLNDGSHTSIICTIGDKNVSYKAVFGENVEGAWTVQIPRRVALSVPHENRKALQSTVR